MDNIFITCNVDSDYAITEIAAIRTNGKIGVLNKKSILSAFTAKVDGNLLKTVNALRDKIDGDDKVIIVSLYPELLLTALKKINQSLYANRIWIDIIQIAWPLLYSHQIPNRSLQTLCHHFKVTYTPNRDAAEDCSALAQVYGAMMQRYQTSLMGEETIRDIGGEVLENIRNIVGF